MTTDEARAAIERICQFFETLAPQSLAQIGAQIGAGGLDLARQAVRTADQIGILRFEGQAALFGGEAQPDTALRLKETEEWTRGERMARERDNFGFYFSAHPVEQFRAIASANGARSFASLMVSGGPSGGRAPAVMAAMVEKVNRGRTRKGKDFVRADFSDSTGQFSAACFEESLVANFVKWADEGTCVLLNVELDSPSPDEPPRVTVRGARPLRDVKAAARMMLSLEAHLPEAIEALRTELVPGPDGQGEVRVTLRTGGEGEPIVRIGRSYQLDGELAERLASIEGLANVQLTTQRGPNLRLVA